MFEQSLPGAEGFDFSGLVQQFAFDTNVVPPVGTGVGADCATLKLHTPQRKQGGRQHMDVTVG